MRVLLLFYILCVFFNTYAQSQGNQPINPNGFNTFYHDNGKVSSEGIMQDGKPNGYWKTYFPNGKIKSEGTRKNFQLDSIWKFYTEDGKLLFEYTYKDGKKNGRKRNYDPKGHFLISDETFKDDIKQGYTTLYYKNGAVKQKIYFVAGKEEGVSYEFDTIQNINGIIEYKMGFIRRQEKINRTDKNNLKQGIWKEFWPCIKDCESGKALIVKREAKYTDGLLDGYVKEYGADGNLLKTAKYEMGKLIANAPELAKLEVKNEYGAGGIIKASGSYKDGVPEGIHREFDTTGKVIASRTFKDGLLVSKGIVDGEGRAQGPWEDYYPGGQLRSKGVYKDGKRIGEWIFYHANGKIEQQGKYDQSGRTQGVWRWYYETGNLLREENYLNNLRDGTSIEYNDSGKVITKGDFFDGQKEGKWFYELEDYREEGNYKADRRDGIWKHYYTTNGKLRFEGNFIDGTPDGKHTYYYSDGKEAEYGKYAGGNKDGDWKYYDEFGMLILTITYKDGVEIKFDGVKIRPTQEELNKIQSESSR